MRSSVPASGRTGWGIGFWGGLVAVCLLATASGAADPEVAWLRIPVRDEIGAKLTAGRVMFCPATAECLALVIDDDSTIRLDRRLLTPNAAYTVLVYAADGSLRYSDTYWAYDMAVPVDATPEVTGQLGQRLHVVVPPLADQRREAAARTSAPRAQVREREHRPSRAIGALLMPLMFGGKFAADPDAFVGVSEVAAGFGLTGGYRFGLPHHRTLGRTTDTFKELSLTYVQNRYHVDPIQSTDAGSDLTFHRFLVSYGLGRFWYRSLATLSVAAGYGGLYDGGTLVKYGDRSYGMFGVGLQARFVHRIFGRPDGFAAGVLGQLEVMYYFADAADNDHWYGWAPAVVFGLAMY